MVWSCSLKNRKGMSHVKRGKNTTTRAWPLKSQFVMLLTQAQFIVILPTRVPSLKGVSWSYVSSRPHCVTNYSHMNALKSSKKRCLIKSGLSSIRLDCHNVKMNNGSEFSSSFRFVHERFRVWAFDGPHVTLCNMVFH